MENIKQMENLLCEKQIKGQCVPQSYGKILVLHYPIVCGRVSSYVIRNVWSKFRCK